MIERKTFKIIAKDRRTKKILTTYCYAPNFKLAYEKSCIVWGVGFVEDVKEVGFFEKLNISIQGYTIHNFNDLIEMKEIREKREEEFIENLYNTKPIKEKTSNTIIKIDTKEIKEVVDKAIKKEKEAMKKRIKQQQRKPIKFYKYIEFIEAFAKEAKLDSVNKYEKIEKEDGERLIKISGKQDVISVMEQNSETFKKTRSANVSITIKYSVFEKYIKTGKLTLNESEVVEIDGYLRILDTWGEWKKVEKEPSYKDITDYEGNPLKWRDVSINGKQTAYKSANVSGLNFIQTKR